MLWFIHSAYRVQLVKTYHSISACILTILKIIKFGMSKFDLKPISYNIRSLGYLRNLGYVIIINSLTSIIWDFYNVVGKAFKEIDILHLRFFKKRLADVHMIIFNALKTLQKIILIQRMFHIYLVFIK